MKCTPFEMGDGTRGIMCTCTPDYVITDETGKEWRFEMNRYSGPVVVGMRGDPLSEQPGQRSAFWPAFRAWQETMEKR